MVSANASCSFNSIKINMSSFPRIRAVLRVSGRQKECAYKWKTQRPSCNFPPPVMEIRFNLDPPPRTEMLRFYRLVFKQARPLPFPFVCASQVPL